MVPAKVDQYGRLQCGKTQEDGTDMEGVKTHATAETNQIRVGGTPTDTNTTGGNR